MGGLMPWWPHARSLCGALRQSNGDLPTLPRSAANIARYTSKGKLLQFDAPRCAGPWAELIMTMSNFSLDWKLLSHAVENYPVGAARVYRAFLPESARRCPYTTHQHHTCRDQSLHLIF
eukprot:5764473-Amphidinium_carterae.1